MRFLTRILVAAAAVLIASPHRCPAPDVFTDTPEATVEDAADAANQFQIAAQAEGGGNLGRALAGYRTVVKRFPKSAEAENAQMKVGELQEKAGDFRRAFDAYQKLVKDYPNSKQFDKAIESQFKIGTLYLEGERQRLLGIPTLPSMDRARTIFEAVIANAPFSKYAALSQFNVGLTHERQDNPTAAVEAYQRTIEQYPTSDVADDAQYQMAYVYFTQARRGSYDQTTAQKARESFEDFLVRYPDSEKVPQAKENLGMLSGRQISGGMEIAKFYDKQKKYKAAVIYYQQVIEQQPGSEQAEEATARIEQLRDLVGVEALQVGSEKAETGEMASVRRRFQALVDTAARPDYAGPPAPIVPDELPPDRPRMRTSPSDVTPLPAVEPELPQ